MSYDINIHGIGMKEKNVKDLIVNLLMVEWPQTLKKLHSSIKKRYRLSVSHQAVFKALSELNEKNIVVKNNREYSLNIEWIKELKEFSSVAQEAYLQKSPIIKGELKCDGDLQIHSFDNLFNLDRFIMSLMEKFLTNKEFENVKCYSNWKFAWWPLFISREEYSTLKRVINPKRIYLGINDNSSIARFCLNFYKKVGINSKINVKETSDFDFIVVNDLVLQVYYPSKLLKRIEKIFSKVKRFEDLDMNRIVEIFEANEKIDAIILKNSSIARLLAEKTVSNFFKK